MTLCRPPPSECHVFFEWPLTIRANNFNVCNREFDDDCAIYHKDHVCGCGAEAVFFKGLRLDTRDYPLPINPWPSLSPDYHYWSVGIGNMVTISHDHGQYQPRLVGTVHYQFFIHVLLLGFIIMLFSNFNNQYLIYKYSQICAYDHMSKMTTLNPVQAVLSLNH